MNQSSRDAGIPESLNLHDTVVPENERRTIGEKILTRLTESVIRIGIIRPIPVHLNDRELHASSAADGP